MKNLILVLISWFLLAGCAGVDATNQLIADSNNNRLDQYGKAMAACGDNAACQVGVSAAYFSGAGQQQFFRPDTPVDYLRAGLPYADLGARIFNSWWNSGGVSGDRTGGTVIIGDNNQLSGFSNRLTADNKSSISASFDATPSVSQSWSWENMYNPTTDNSRDQVVK